MTEAYGFDSYNQYCWPEIEHTIRSHGGGDTVPKCFVRKKHDSKPLGCPEQTHQYNGRNTSCDICRGAHMDGI